MYETLLRLWEKYDFNPQMSHDEKYKYIRDLSDDVVEEACVIIQRDHIKISNLDVIAALRQYDKTPKYNTHLRVGQYLCCVFRITDPKVFFEENEGKAKKLFTRRYVVK